MYVVARTIVQDCAAAMRTRTSPLWFCLIHHFAWNFCPSVQAFLGVVPKDAAVAAAGFVGTNESMLGILVESGPKIGNDGVQHQSVLPHVASGDGRVFGPSLLLHEPRHLPCCWFTEWLLLAIGCESGNPGGENIKELGSAISRHQPDEDASGKWFGEADVLVADATVPPIEGAGILFHQDVQLRHGFHGASQSGAPSVAASHDDSCHDAFHHGVSASGEMSFAVDICIFGPQVLERDPHATANDVDGILGILDVSVAGVLV